MDHFPTEEGNAGLRLAKNRIQRLTGAGINGRFPGSDILVYEPGNKRLDKHGKTVRNLLVHRPPKRAQINLRAKQLGFRSPLLTETETDTTNQQDQVTTNCH
jgi:hypothetical protein